MCLNNFLLFLFQILQLHKKPSLATTGLTASMLLIPPAPTSVSPYTVYFAMCKFQTLKSATGTTPEQRTLVVRTV